MSKSSQLGALMTKNLIMMKRNGCATCCEIVFPMILMILLVLVRRAIKQEVYPEPVDDQLFLKTNSSALINPELMVNLYKNSSESTWNGLTIRRPL
jgi:hypothetical protein